MITRQKKGEYTEKVSEKIYLNDVEKTRSEIDKLFGTSIQLDKSVEAAKIIFE